MDPTWDARLIGIIGPAGSGKSTASKILCQRFAFVGTKFAAGLKTMLAGLYTTMGLEEHEIFERIEGSLKDKPDGFLDGISPRRAMQTLGQEWGRDLVHVDFWVNAWERGALYHLSKGRSVVVDDVRYPNEVERIKQMGGTTIGLIGRGGIEGSHQSEANELRADVILSNHGSILDLERKIETFLNVT